MTAELERSAPPGNTRGFVPVVLPLATAIVGDVQPLIVALMMAVGLVLLIASANVANLVLLRGESRRQELAVRAALGASRGRIVAHVLTESVVLTLTAGVAGLRVRLVDVACAGRQSSRRTPARRHPSASTASSSPRSPSASVSPPRSPVSFRPGCWREVTSPRRSAAAAAARSAVPGGGRAARSWLFRCRSRSPSSRRRACWYARSSTCSRSKRICLRRSRSHGAVAAARQVRPARAARAVPAAGDDRARDCSRYPGGDAGQQRTFLARMGRSPLHRRRSERRTRWPATRR